MSGTDDFDIEAMLDAPLLSKKESSRNHGPLDEVIGEARRDARHHHDRHHHSRDRDRDRYDREKRSDRDRYYDKERRHRSRSPRSRDHKNRSRSPVREKSPPLSEAQRDRRTVFVRQLAQRVRTADLGPFLESGAGPIRDVRIVYDRVSGRSKGVAYVEFRDEASVEKAIAMTGQKLCGIPVIIELTETEKNRLAEEAAEMAKRNKVQSDLSRGNSGYGSMQSSAPTSTNTMTRVHVGGLHPSLDVAGLRRVFEPFGDIAEIQINSAAQTAHIHFKNGADAAMAVDQMNGFELAGRPIRVGILRDRPDGTSNIQYKAGDVFTSNLDDADTKGLNLSAKTRTELMMKLARDTISIPGNPHGPSACLMLSGMYDPEEETELGWEYTIADEVRDECASRFGPVVHIAVAKNKDGDVYVRFGNVAAGQAAMAGLNGRWFGGRQVKALFMDTSAYERKFSL